MPTKPTTPFEGMRLLAAWFDAKDPGGPTEVQDDLRRWADEVALDRAKISEITRLLDQRLMDSLNGKIPASDGDTIEAVAQILAYSDLEGMIRSQIRQACDDLLIGTGDGSGMMGIVPEPWTVASRLRDAKYRIEIAVDDVWWWVRDHLVPLQLCNYCLTPFWTLTPWRTYHCDHPNCQVVADFMSLGEDSDG